MRIGVDITNKDRIKKVYKKFGEKFAKRVLTQNENPKKLPNYWAAKEAFAKAIGTGIGKECSFLDIEILKDKKGKPLISSKTLKKFNISQADISITHDEKNVIAVVVILKI
ncbi:MAG: holo-ACP synthase [Nautiliaceae bacterium]